MYQPTIRQDAAARSGLPPQGAPTDAEPTQANRDTVITTSFVIVAAILLVATVFRVPIYQVPDEPQHLLRAEQLSHGSFIGWRVGDVAGANVDSGLAMMTRRVAIDPDADLMDAVHDIAWQGRREFVPFGNTVRYPPWLYIPQALGLAVAKQCGLSVFHSIYVARVANAACCLAAMAWAVYHCRRGRLFLCLCLLLPMSTFELGSAAQDAGIIAASAVLFALLSYGRNMSVRSFGALAVCLGILSSARLPLIGLIPLLALPEGARHIRVRHRCWAAAACLSSVALCCAIFMRPQGVINPGVPSSPVPQFQFLMAHPVLWLKLPYEAITSEFSNIWHMTIGVLGWLQIWLPEWAYQAGAASIILAAAVNRGDATRNSWKERGAVVAAVVLTVFLILMASYLTWNPVGAPHVQGLQGRYFIPLMMLVPLLVPTWPGLSDKRHIALSCMACICMGATVVAAWQAIVAHYPSATAWH